jgi:hypothetical protein
MYQLLMNFYANNKKFAEIFSDAFFNINKNFTLAKKIKYMHLYDDFEILSTDEIPQNCYNFIILPLSREKLFYCMAIFEKRSFMKITNKTGIELHRTNIDVDYYYRQFLVHGKNFLLQNILI